MEQTTSMSGQPAQAQAVYRWTVHPAAERPRAALLAAIATGALAASAGLAGGWPWACVALAVLVWSLRRFWLPTQLQIDADGITARRLTGTRRVRWDGVRRWCCDRWGVYLSGRSQPSWLDAYRGMHILFGRHRAEVLRRIEARLGPAGCGLRDRRCVSDGAAQQESVAQ